MAQSLPHSHPPSPPDTDLHWLPGRRPPAAPSRRLRHGLALIALVGGAALAYLCLLVRISSVDVACHRLETRCEELRTVIATDMTELSGLSDTATSLDRAQGNGLCPPEGEDRLAVSPGLCRPGGAEPWNTPQAAPPSGMALPAGMGAY